MLLRLRHLLSGQSWKPDSNACPAMAIQHPAPVLALLEPTEFPSRGLQWQSHLGKCLQSEWNTKL